MNWKFWKGKVDPAIVFQQEILLGLYEISDELKKEMREANNTLSETYKKYTRGVGKETRKLERARAKLGEKARRMKTKYKDRRRGVFDTSEPDVQKALKYMAGEHWITCKSCGKGYFSNYSRCFGCARVTLSNILEMLEDGDNLV